MFAKSGADINTATNQSNSALADVDPKACVSLPIPYTFVEREVEGFISTIERLERVVDLETNTLQSRQPIALQDFNHKKIFGLLELIRVLPRQEAHPPTAEMEMVLSRLRKKLEKNLFVLQMHLTAIHEISTIIANAIKEHESDGTYSGRMSGSGALR